jgi:pimeloyl-ACP methyl ester carboxylesterase
VNGQRDAVILLSGLHREDIGESVDSAAARFVAALESEAQSVAATFVLENARDEDYGQTGGYKTRIVTVSRKDPGGGPPSALFDLYGLDYRKTLVGDLENKRPVSHLLSTFWILASNTPKLLFSVRRRSKRSSEKWQVRLGWSLYFLLFAYFVTIVGAAAGTVATFATPSVQAEDTATSLARSMAASVVPLTQMMQVIVVWVTAVGLFLKADLKAWVQKSGLGITVANQYLTLGLRRRAVEDQFAALLNHLGQKPDVQYQRVHVVGYSFGSIIALDALFPDDQAAAVFGRIHTLVTVGCPFDFVRTYWPTYFQQRTQLGDVPRRWVNIYAAADVLGSDFVDQAAPPQPARLCGITIGNESTPRRPDVNERYGRSTTLEEYSAMEKLGFLGFAMHRQYWDGTGAGCYRNIVRAIFRDEPALI